MRARYPRPERLEKKDMRDLRFSALPLLVLSLALAGCGGGSSDTGGDSTPPTTASSSGNAADVAALMKSVPAGVPVTQSTDATMFPALVKTLGPKYGRRPDPFALTTNERYFETNQAGERTFSTIGFTIQVQPKEEPGQAALVAPEPQPYRRLAGIVVGDSVLAIIDMGDGRTEIIRPGQKIPNSEWTVVSIDSEKAVLRRGGNVLPKEIIVRLESPPAGMGGTTSTTPPAGQPPYGAGGPPGYPGGPPGYPGGPPGYPGGRGGRAGGGR